MSQEPNGTWQLYTPRLGLGKAADVVLETKKFSTASDDLSVSLSLHNREGYRAMEQGRQAALAELQARIEATMQERNKANVNRLARVEHEIRPLQELMSGLRSQILAADDDLNHTRAELLPGANRRLVELTAKRSSLQGQLTEVEGAASDLLEERDRLESLIHSVPPELANDVKARLTEEFRVRCAEGRQAIEASLNGAIDQQVSNEAGLMSLLQS